MNVSKDKSSPDTGPVYPRPYWVVLLSVAIRALHQVGAAVYLSSYLLDGVAGPPRFYLWLSIGTGLVLLGTEAMRHRAWYREVCGAATVIKIALLGIAYHAYLPEAAAVAVAFVVAALGAHLPKNIRHRLLY
jgi:hypothetical protein